MIFNGQGHRPDLRSIGPMAASKVTNRLIAWGRPAPPDYLRFKRAIFTTAVPGWDRIIVKGDIDLRLVSWGGVLIDNRAFGGTPAACLALAP